MCNFFVWKDSRIKGEIKKLLFVPLTLGFLSLSNWFSFCNNLTDVWHADIISDETAHCVCELGCSTGSSCQVNRSLNWWLCVPPGPFWLCWKPSIYKFQFQQAWPLPTVGWWLVPLESLIASPHFLAARSAALPTPIVGWYLVPATKARSSHLTAVIYAGAVKTMALVRGARPGGRHSPSWGHLTRSHPPMPRLVWSRNFSVLSLEFNFPGNWCEEIELLQSSHEPCPNGDGDSDGDLLGSLLLHSISPRTATWTSVSLTRSYTTTTTPTPLPDWPVWWITKGGFACLLATSFFTCKDICIICWAQLCLCEVQFHGPHQISLQLLGLQDSEFCDPSIVLDLDPDSLPLVR